MVNKLNIEDVEEYKNMYIELLRLEFADLDFSKPALADDLYNGLQEIPEGFPKELVDWHKKELIYSFVKNYKPSN